MGIRIKSNRIDKYSATPNILVLPPKGSSIVKIDYHLTDLKEKMSNHKFRIEAIKLKSYEAEQDSRYIEEILNKSAVRNSEQAMKKTGDSFAIFNRLGYFYFEKHCRLNIINDPREENFGGLQYKAESFNLNKDESSYMIKDPLSKNLKKEIKHLSEKLINLKFDCNRLEQLVDQENKKSKDQFYMLTKRRFAYFNIIVELNEARTKLFDLKPDRMNYYCIVKSLFKTFILFFLIGAFLIY